MRLAAGPHKTLLEFGLRRAQGPDGGMSASKYTFIGGFDGTANVLAGKLLGLDVRGTHAHAYVMSHTGLESLHSTTIVTPTGATVAEMLKLLYPAPRPDEPPDGWDELREALEVWAPGRPGAPPDPRALGRRFRSSKGRILTGHRLEAAPGHAGVVRWLSRAV